MNEPTVLDFITNAFHSIWPIELLLVLAREPRQGWSVEALARELRANISVVDQGLHALTSLRFVIADRDRGYRLEPGSPELDQMAHSITELYARKPRAVIRAIFSRPEDKMRKFSDAFRLRRDAC